MAQQRGELALLELEEKALEAVEHAWREYQSQGQLGLVPTKLVGLVVEVHKMIMQRMNSKYGLDAGKLNLSQVRDALNKEMQMLDKMIEHEQQGLQ